MYLTRLDNKILYSVITNTGICNIIIALAIKQLIFKLGFLVKFYHGISTFSPNQAILNTFRFFLKKTKKFFWGGWGLNVLPIIFLAKSGNFKHISGLKNMGGGVTFFETILINFLATSGNYIRLSFFSFFSKNK